MTRVALVTGANKGIGYEIVRSLCKEINGTVILTARDNDRGYKAVEKLKGEGLSPEFIQLDLTSKESIQKAKAIVQDKYGGLDILINNAGIAYKVASTAPFAEQAEVTVATNYLGTALVCEEFFPILRPFARVVTVASFAGRLLQVSKELQKEFSKEDLTKDELQKLMQKFVNAAKEGKHKDLGFSGTAYGMSKLAAIALTRIQAREMLQDPRENILINAVCPGYVRTDMAGPNAPLSAEEGADTPVFAALFPAGQTHPNGEFIRNRTVTNWLDMSVKQSKCPYMQ